jgi:hypothetical protein
LRAACVLASSSNYVGKIFPGASSSSIQHPTPPREFRPPNGSRSFEENPSTSTTSSLQLSTLRSMRIRRRALERHLLLLAQAKHRGRSGAQLTGQRHGDGPQRQLSSLSPIEEKSWNSIKHTSRSSLTPDNSTLIKESSHTTLPSEISLGEDKCLCSPSMTDSPTYIQSSSCLTELSSPPPTLHPPIPRPRHVEPSSLRDQKGLPKRAINTTLTRGVPTTLVSTGTSAKSAEEITPKVNTTHRSNEEGLQPKYRRYNLWGANNQKPMTTAEWSETAVPLPRSPKSELENPVANVTIASHAHLFNVQTPININIFQSLLSSHPN